MIYRKILAFIPLKTINRESSAKHFTNTLQVFLPVYSHWKEVALKPNYFITIRKL